MRPCWSAPVGSEELSRWSDFQGLYHQMYDDTFVVDETAICERVLQWPEFWDEEKEELIFSLEDCETFADTNTLTYFVNTHLLSKTDADYWMGVVQNRYNSEKVLWQKEYDLKRTLSFSNIIALYKPFPLRIYSVFVAPLRVTLIVPFTCTSFP